MSSMGSSKHNYDESLESLLKRCSISNPRSQGASTWLGEEIPVYSQCSVINLDDDECGEDTRHSHTNIFVMKKAEMYQQYMKQIPIPIHRKSVIPFTSWIGLGQSVKRLYQQPLHYLTNVLLKKWDQERIGSEDEHQPLDSIIHPCNAEATIWLIEEIHRKTSSSHHIAKLWLSDPMHDAYVDSVFPNLGS